MLHGFRLILLIGVFLAIAGSIQSGDWSYSLWIILVLSSVLVASFKAPKVSQPHEEMEALKSSMAFSLSSYYPTEHNSDNASSSLNSEHY
ncbi:MAG: hypothetical protein CMK64_12405 [Pseudoalteromonas sp.]|nr:hypothetical protein [Pseudoalteromonas sp.]|tara:strand:- start:1147 stop:1416 length:270 start_codon:yes stop_codon:yes gene_type:complete